MSTFANTSSKLPESEAAPAEIIVFICPTKGCGNHYASRNFRPDRTDIEAIQHHRSQNDGSKVDSHSRIECPDCRVLRSIRVDRIPYVVTQVVGLQKIIDAQKKNAKKAKKRVKKEQHAAST